MNEINRDIKHTEHWCNQVSWALRHVCNCKELSRLRLGRLPLEERINQEKSKIICGEKKRENSIW